MFGLPFKILDFWIPILLGSIKTGDGFSFLGKNHFQDKTLKGLHIVLTCNEVSLSAQSGRGVGGGIVTQLKPTVLVRGQPNI